MYKKLNKYFKEHSFYNSSVHLLIGVGLGILLTYPYIGAHPVRWGVAILIIGGLGHLYPLMTRGK